MIYYRLASTGRIVSNKPPRNVNNLSPSSFIVSNGSRITTCQWRLHTSTCGPPSGPYFKVTPYKPPPDRFALYKDITPDKFFVQLTNHISLPTESKLDEQTYKQCKPLSIGSLVKLKSGDFDEQHSNTQIGSMLNKGEAASMAMSDAIATIDFGFVVNHRPYRGRDMWWIRKYNGEEGLVDTLNLSVGSRRCVMSFPSVARVDFINCVRFMWPENIDEDSVTVTVDGMPAEAVIRSSDILGGRVDITIDGRDIKFVGDEEYMEREMENDTKAAVVSRVVWGLEKFTYAWFGVTIIGGTMYFVVIEPYFGPMWPFN